MPCVEGDRSDCQPEASSIARSRRSIVHLPCLSLYFGPICKTQRIEHELVHGLSNNSLPCKQMIIFSPLLLVSTQLVNVPLLLRNEFAAKYRNFNQNHGTELWNFIRIIWWSNNICPKLTC